MLGSYPPLYKRIYENKNKQRIGGSDRVDWFSIEVNDGVIGVLPVQHTLVVPAGGTLGVLSCPTKFSRSRVSVPVGRDVSWCVPLCPVHRPDSHTPETESLILTRPPDSEWTGTLGCPRETPFSRTVRHPRHRPLRSEVGQGPLCRGGGLTTVVVRGEGEELSVVGTSLGRATSVDPTGRNSLGLWSLPSTLFSVDSCVWSLHVGLLCVVYVHRSSPFLSPFWCHPQFCPRFGS